MQVCVFVRVPCYLCPRGLLKRKLFKRSRSRCVFDGVLCEKGRTRRCRKVLNKPERFCCCSFFFFGGLFLPKLLTSDAVFPKMLMSQSYHARKHNVGFWPLQLSKCWKEIGIPLSLTLKMGVKQVNSLVSAAKTLS